MLLNALKMGIIIIYTLHIFPIIICIYHDRSFVIKEFKKIIYAEDDIDIRVIVKIVLEAKNPNVRVDFANNGSELLTMLKYSHPDLILLDVMMPKMDGPTVLDKIKSNDNLKDIPVIFLTSRVQPQEIKELEKMEVIGIIQKPFETMKLYDTIKNIWDAHYVQV